MPWWVGYLVRAEQWGVPPWELLEEKTPKRFWMECAVLLDQGREAVRQRDERELKKQQEKGNQGRG